MSTQRIIFVGGFLGAGKTTLMFETAKRLTAKGKRVGLITNDQAPELVDTAFLRTTGSAVTEVSGSCFCCNFPGLVGAIEKLSADAQTEVILAEPVGSCTDLSATIIQPLKDKKGGDVSLAPFSVLADPKRLQGILDGNSAGLHDSSAYIFRKQLEEADFILLTKADTLDEATLSALGIRLASAYPEAEVFVVSAKSGAGLDAWLDAVMTRTGAGTHLCAEVDYDVYAEGEAVLGWLNATYKLTSAQAVDWKAFAENLLDALSRAFDAMPAAVGHVKLAITSGTSLVTANLVGTRETLEVHGDAVNGTDATLTLNARAQMTPEQLEAIVREQMAKACGEAITAQTVAWRCLSPGYPNPTYRYGKVVSE
ncbi:MAG: cobalamin synthesis protein P47K [Kiritimatiellaeota bacterium]|nr:cobalamin synthesis protein P47K [Kiritimatiellota bacterium]